ncbi:MAG TPA: non-homologous end-joining DNA ligase [Frankiaceae bacterium]|nr:non-homologous end-joining DNA ligase [Frankiaceae bacterium]
MSPASVKVPVDIEGRRLTLSNLQKVLYPQTGFAKAQVLDYYTRVSPFLLPHLRDRPLTRKRYPNGVDGGSFFEKNTPSHRPEWVRTATVASPGSTRNRETIDYVVCDDLPTLVWLANLASLELHTPMWRVSTGLPDMMVVDLDPGPPATIVECCRVASLVRDATGLDWYAKTSGSKGLQLYTAVRDGRTSEQTSAEMKALAERLEKEEPDLVVSRMTKAIRPGKVLLDWSQNSSAKTTVSVYSLRARPEHTVSTPVTWDEVEACRAPEDLVFRTDDVLARVDEFGDLFAPLL